MNMIRFINELAANVGIGAGEKRFAQTWPGRWVSAFTSRSTVEGSRPARRRHQHQRRRQRRPSPIAPHSKPAWSMAGRGDSIERIVPTCSGLPNGSVT